GGQPVGEEVPLDVAEAGLLDIGLGKDGSAAASNNRTRPGEWLHPGHATRATAATRNSWEPLLSVVWRVGAPPEPYRPFCHRRWSGGTKGVSDPNSRIVLAIAEVLREDEGTAQ